MPKGKPAEPSISELKKMTGSDFALGVWRDLLLLAKDERAKAVRLLNALNTSIDREMEALAPK